MNEHELVQQLLEQYPPIDPPPVPWGPDHPHYRYSRGEQLRLARLQATIAEIYDECSVPVRSWTLGDPEPGTPEPELDDRGQPRPPRPSTTPPMWANNPTRTNRRRNR